MYIQIETAEVANNCLDSEDLIGSLCIPFLYLFNVLLCYFLFTCLAICTSFLWKHFKSLKGKVDHDTQGTKIAITASPNKKCTSGKTNQK